MESHTTTWKIHNIKKQTKRAALLQVIKSHLEHENFTLSFKDNKRLAILITLEDQLPSIVFCNRPLDIRKQKSEERSVKDIVTPLNGMTYEEQLAHKTAKVSDFCSFLNCSEIESISSPMETGYRNKCEFTFGFTGEGKQVLGFRPAKFSSAPNLIADPMECTFNTPPEMLSLVEKINGYLDKNDGLVYNRITKKGLLRLLCLRRIGKHFISILQVNTETFEEALNSQLITDFIKILSEDAFITCSTGIFDGLLRTAEIKQVKGEPKEYEEVLNNCTFKVFPLGFFQVNLGVAELLTRTIQKSIQTETILDICSGSGLLGICTAKGTEKKVFGMEISQESIEDAKRNALINDVSAEYFCGSVEKTLPLVLAKVKETASALVDPPRAGISDKLVNEIISHKNISEIFYISCSYTSVKNNLLNISSKYALKKIYVLDMFPFTADVECIFHFVRKED
ncbi:tRNA (uracil-5-)-methyltransferase [Nematocida minor]|uniref:tRNA (uracil-5-)-methyltransferase n=1 Tax=Nematocida minor TaxID=1912983 RepID=UPI00221EECBF|nr:tRNA (uracil-5-)-methyltransferase [Nematocida minor]KAI5189391.1 tRNA (uracil-5-)-methyltransferase [Nematocida minor]